MKVLIVDDELKAREVLKKLILLTEFELEILGEADGVESAEKLIRNLNTKIDVLFLDINMKDGSGFDLLNRIQPIEFNLIFTTAYDEFALKAIKEDALDYLLKPIELSELEKALEKANQKLTKEISTSPNKNSKLLIPQKNGYRIVSPNDILYIEGDGSYSRIVLKNDESFQSTKIIKEFEEILPESTFYRVHKSYIINIEGVVHIDKNNQLVLKNGDTIEMSRRKKQEFINNFLKI